jgi:uncharacterized protein (TIGR00299 family) protein
MCLGALIHAGVPVEYLAKMLNRLGIDREYNLWAERVLRNSQQATKVHVELLPQPPKQDHSDHSSQAPHAHPPSHSDPNAFESLPTQPDPTQPDPTQPDLNTENSSSEQGFDHRRDRDRESHPDHNHSKHPDHHNHPDVAHSHAHPGTRHLPEIEALIQAAQLPQRVEAWSLNIFRQLAIAEGAVHGIPPEAVHFHEVGATDAIVDIVGTCLGLDWLKIDMLYCSALPTGGGTVRAAHGLLPVPAPAVLKLWEMRQIPLYSNGIQKELVTPTGAAIVTTLAQEFGDPPPMTLQRVGLGAGSRNLKIPNILRLWIGEQQRDQDQENHHRQAIELTPFSGSQLTQESATLNTANSFGDSAALSTTTEPIVVLETQIDDLSPQAIGYLYEPLFAAGALDVFTQPIGMKKSRLGVLLSVVCHPHQADACEAILFRETTTLGVRRLMQQRSILPRTIQTVETPYGAVRIKVTERGSYTAIGNGHPEYEDCVRLAQTANVPWQEVHRMALYCWYQKYQRSIAAPKHNP